MANETSSNNAQASPVVTAIKTMIYLGIFLTSELGNGFVIFSLLVRKRRGRTAMDEYVLSLATTDFLFTNLSLLYAVEYLLDEWKLGVAVCKIQSQLLEVTYIVSSLTLTMISYSRYKAANVENPFILYRQKPTTRRNIALIWSFSFLFSLPLFYGYTVVLKGGALHCTNLNFNEVTRQIYYLALAVLLFFLPITVMIVSQYKISRGFRSHSQRRTADITTAAISARVKIHERRITRLLTWVWIIFMCCCAPFTTYRTLDYFAHIRKRGHVSNQIWQISQVLIVLNAAVNPFLYHRMTRNSVGDRRKARCIEWCCIHRAVRRHHVVSVSTRSGFATTGSQTGGAVCTVLN